MGHQVIEIMKPEEQAKHHPLFHYKRDSPLPVLLNIWKRIQECHGLFKTGHGLLQAIGLFSLLARQSQIVHGLLFILTPYVVVGQQLIVFFQPFSVYFFYGPTDLFMYLLASLKQQAVIGDFLSQGMLEDIFQLRKKLLLVDKFQALKIEQMHP